jgi:hypothetical protein
VAEVTVFLGPTLPKKLAARILAANYRPPAEQGSIVEAVRTDRPRAIVLIDGAFGKVPAVRHKEILWALAQGIRVFGAASVGAIRAAELTMLGMQGHGFVYRWYALTPLADDDEVAVAMTPGELGAEPLSEALINIRLTLRAAERAGVLTPVERQTLEGIARAMHFVDRSYPQLLAEARSAPLAPAEPALRRLADWLPDNAIDRKREDAVSLLSALAQRPELLEAKRQVPPFRLTEAWAYDLDAAGLLGDDIADVGMARER